MGNPLNSTPKDVSAPPTEATKAVRTSALFQSFAASHPNVEVWPDREFSEGGWEYFWIVALTDGTARHLAYTRWKANRLQHRTYDSKGDDVWTDSQ
jgi:hypothetical protein